jgi:hypothetical protein
MPHGAEPGMMTLTIGTGGGVAAMIYVLFIFNR